MPKFPPQGNGVGRRTRSTPQGGPAVEARMGLWHPPPWLWVRGDSRCLIFIWVLIPLWMALAGLCKRPVGDRSGETARLL